MIEAPHILFFARFGSDIGYGHLSRCASYSDAFRKMGKKTALWQVKRLNEKSDEGNTPFLNQFDQKFYGDPTSVSNQLKTKPKYLFFDSYEIGSHLLKECREEFPQTVFVAIDDNLEKANLLLDKIVHLGGIEEKILLETFPNSEILMGWKYSPLSIEWKTLGRDAENFNPKLEKIGICFGGSDPDNASLRITKLLIEEAEDSEIELFTGPGYQFTESLRGLESTPNFTHFSNVPDFKERISSLDMVISSGGVTAIELLSIGMPLIIVPTHSNQVPVCHKIEKMNLALVLSDLKDLERDGLHRAFVEMKKQDSRRDFSKRARAAIDFDGPERLALVLI